MRKIGLDLGIKTCGIAISDPNNKFAIGLMNYEFQRNNYSQVIKKLKLILTEYNDEIDVIVLGYAKNLNRDNDNEATIRTRNFKSLLEQNFSQKIVLQDENYSTVRATERLIKDNIKSSQRKKIIDMVSATIILQDYLDGCFDYFDSKNNKIL